MDFDGKYQLSNYNRKLTGTTTYFIDGESMPETAVVSKGIYTISEEESGEYVAEFTAPVNKKLTSVTIPAVINVNEETVKVISVASNAFRSNTKLKKAVIGKNVQKIGANAFYKCTSLTQITIPAKVEKIEKQAFCGCRKLKNITIKTKLLTGKSIGKKAFKNVYSAVNVKVPKSKKAEYKKILLTRGLTQNAKIK